MTMHSLHPSSRGWREIEVAPLASEAHAQLYAPRVHMMGAGDEAMQLEQAEERAFARPDLTRGEWYAFLEGLGAPSGELARRFWTALQREIGYVPVPQAGCLPEGGFQFVWDLREHHLEIDALEDGSVSWFYRNRRTNHVDGADCSVPPFSDSLSEYFTLLR